MEIRPILSALLRSKTGAILVALQVAISLAILANALHIVNVRQAVAARSAGIENEADVLHISVRHLVKAGHNEQMALQKAETDALRAVSGVTSVAFVNQVPLSYSGGYNSVAADPKQTRPSGNLAYYTSPDSIVQTWGLKLVEGRDYRPDEVLEVDSNANPDAIPKVLLLTRAAAKKIWPDAASAVGKMLYMGTGADASSAQVIGVVDHLQTVQGELGELGELSMIVPIRMSNAGTVFAIRAAAGQRERVAREAEAALRQVNGAGHPIIVRIKAFSKARSERYRADTGLSWMLIAVSVLLLLITASGIVGMASLWVIQRRKQIGVRRALGARKIDILRYFVTENVLITSLGIVGGVMLAVGLNQFLVAHLGMTRLPLAYLAAGALVFWGLGIAAVYGPAWRGASISPATATRST